MTNVGKPWLLLLITAKVYQQTTDCSFTACHIIILISAQCRHNFRVLSCIFQSRIFRLLAWPQILSSIFRSSILRSRIFSAPLIASKFQRQVGYFWQLRVRIMCPEVIVTMSDNQKWHYGLQNGKYLYRLNHDRKDDNSDGKSGIFGHAQLEETDTEWLRQRPTTGNSDVAAKTGNSYITGTTTDSVEITTASQVFVTIVSPNKVP